MSSQKKKDIPKVTDLRILDVKKPKSNWISVNDMLPSLPACVLFISPPASGKTLLLINWVYRMYAGLFDEIWWCSPTINLDNTAKTSVNIDETINKITDPDDLENLDLIITNIIETQKKKLKDGEDLDEVLLILDDCLAFVNKKALLNLCTQYRHLRITVWISIQKMKMLNNTLRTCASDIISFAIPNTKQRLMFFEEYDVFPEIEKYYEESTNVKYNYMRLNLRDMKIYHGSPDGIKMIYEK
jgi:hypothetical protein